MAGEFINITPDAKHMKQHGFSTQADDPINQPHPDSYYGSEESKRIWLTHKGELYALTSILIDRVVNRALNYRAQRPPYGLIRYNSWEKFPPPDSLSHTAHSYHVVDDPRDVANPKSLSSSMRSTLIRALNEEFDYLETLDEDPLELVSIFKRYVQLIEFRNKFPELSREPRRFIEGGIGTGADTMAQMLEIIPMVYRGKFPNGEDRAEDFIAVARNSFPLITLLAGQQFYDFLGILETITADSPERRFDPNFFEIISRRSRLALTISTDALNYSPEEIEVYKTETMPLVGEDRFGCPALVNLNGGSAIRKMWDWYLELAEVMYRYHYPPDSQLPEKPRRFSPRRILKLLPHQRTTPKDL